MKHPRKFKEKRPPVKAILLGEENIDVVMRWIGQNTSTPIYKRMNDTFMLDLIEGELVIELGWWIVKDADSNFSACTPRYFEENYTEDYGS